MLEDLTPPASGRTCKVAVIGATLSDTDRKILEDAIASRDLWPIKTLSKELRRRGIELSDTPLTNHRNKTCVCFSK